MLATSTNQKAEEIVKGVKNLPSLPAVIQKLIMILEDLSCSTMDIERIVSTDPALTARILKLANSPLYKGVHEVATISQAATRLGFWKLRDVAISIGTTESLSGMADEKAQQTYWHHAVYTATCANILAKTGGMPIPEETFVTGLLHDIGELVFAAVSPEQFALLQAIKPHNRLGKEEELFGTTHTRIGNLLLKQWLLPKRLCDTVRLHHNEQIYTSKREPVLSIVALADMMSKVHGLGSEPNCSAATLALLIKRSGVNVDQISEVLRQVDQQVANTQKDLEIAGDVSFLTPPSSSRNYKIAMVSSQQSTTMWMEQLLSYLGHTALPVSDFMEDPETAHLVILDPDASNTALLTRMQPILEQMQNHLVILESETAPAIGFLAKMKLPEIPLFLTQEKIRQYAKTNF